MLEGKVRFARLNCDRYRQACGKAGVRAYPTLKLYSTKRHRKSLQDGLRLESTTAESIRDEVRMQLPQKIKSKHDEL